MNQIIMVVTLSRDYFTTGPDSFLDQCIMGAKGPLNITEFGIVLEHSNFQETHFSILLEYI